ncbi:protein kinase [Mycoemilia scoparia]|uniref:Protein kinase n=1 Tax=Mycoemilia scoparia TaxID=417184 RepID=A0A9W8DNL6_9FUNG|nr:protein kinase [Mycoemilia scoparia]
MANHSGEYGISPPAQREPEDNIDEKIDDAVDITVIENQKENIQPLKQGRSAKTLSALYSSHPDALARGAGSVKIGRGALAPKSIAKSSESSEDGGVGPSNNNSNDEDATRGSTSIIEQGHLEFQREIAEIDPDCDDDPLDVYFRYARWAMEVHTQGGAQSELVQLLEKPLRQFRDQERYRNDTRYVKMWIWYTTVINQGQEEVFKYLLANKIGDALAVLYEEFSDLLESRGKYNQAHDTYSLGINRKAQPLDRLKRRHDAFEKRLAAYLAKKQSEGEDSDEDALINGPPREGSGPASSSRTMLGVKRSSRSAISAHPNTLHQPSTSRGLGGSRLGDVGARGRGRIGVVQRDSASSRAATNPKSNKGKIAVFADPDGTAGQSASQKQGSAWLDIGTSATRSKENVREATAWRGQTLKQAPGRPGASRPATQPVEKFEVFRDEAEEGNDADHEDSLSPSQKEQQHLSGQVLAAKDKDSVGATGFSSDKFLRSIEQPSEKEGAQSQKKKEQPSSSTRSAAPSKLTKPSAFSIDLEFLRAENIDHSKDIEFTMTHSVEEMRANLPKYKIETAALAMKFKKSMSLRDEPKNSGSAQDPSCQRPKSPKRADPSGYHEYSIPLGPNDDALDGDISTNPTGRKMTGDLPSPTINTRVAQAEMFDIWNEAAPSRPYKQGNPNDEDDDDETPDDDGLNEFERERAKSSTAPKPISNAAADDDDYQFTMGPVKPNLNPSNTPITSLGTPIEQQQHQLHQAPTVQPIHASSKPGRDENDPPTIMLKQHGDIVKPTPRNPRTTASAVSARSGRALAPLSAKKTPGKKAAKPGALFSVFCDDGLPEEDDEEHACLKTPAPLGKKSGERTELPWHSTPAFDGRMCDGSNTEFERGMSHGVSQIGIDPSNGQTMSTIHTLGLTGSGNTFGQLSGHGGIDETEGWTTNAAGTSKSNRNLDITEFNTPGISRHISTIDEGHNEEGYDDDDVGDGEKGYSEKSHDLEDDNALMFDEKLIQSSIQKGDHQCSANRSHSNDDDGIEHSVGNSVKPTRGSPPPFRVFNDNEDEDEDYPGSDTQTKDDDDNMEVAQPQGTDQNAVVPQPAEGTDQNVYYEQDVLQQETSQQPQQLIIIKAFWPLERAVTLIILDSSPEPVESFVGYRNCYETEFKPLLMELEKKLATVEAESKSSLKVGSPLNLFDDEDEDAEEDAEFQRLRKRLRARTVPFYLGVREESVIGKSANSEESEDLAPKRRFEVEKVLREGGFATLYLALDSQAGLNDGDDTTQNGLFDSGDDGNAAEDPTQCVLKVEAPPNVWEFFMMRTLAKRIDEAAAILGENPNMFANTQWLVFPRSIYEYTDFTVTVYPYCHQGSLLDLVNAYKKSVSSSGIRSLDSSHSGCVDELLAMIIISHTIKSVLEIHRLGYIHTDLKPENVMINITDKAMKDPSILLSSVKVYNGDGDELEQQCPSPIIRLIDFGRAVDWTVFEPEQELRYKEPNTSSSATSREEEDLADPVDNGEVPAWLPHADWVGVARIAHILLFGVRMKTKLSKNDEHSHHVTQQFAKGNKPRELVKTSSTTLRRYWQQEIWQRLFAICLSGFPEPKRIDPELGPVIEARQVWQEDIKQRIEPEIQNLLADMDRWIVAQYYKRGKDVDKGLPSLLRQLYLKVSAYCL